MSTLPQDYRQKVYAGWVGKSIGVRYGAPIENWTYEEIKANLGPLTSYLPLEPGKIFKPDDDTAFPMVLIRALRDWNEPVSESTFAEGMLNYLADQRGTLWWGGYGVSTEHTAYVNLANGVDPLLAGSAALNGPTMAEQIGGQIFSDLWGMVYPNNPERAAHISAVASSISHDGEGLEGARFVAALASLAFSFTTAKELIIQAKKVLDPESEYLRMVEALLGHYQENPDDWHRAYQFIFDHFGYDRYSGVVPIIPNGGVIVLSLLYGEGDFSQTISIGNMCGWDTDCNVGNLGAIMGIAVGIEGIDSRWREPMNDELVLASVIGSENYLDLPACADLIASQGERLANVPRTEEKPKYHFSYPGSTHGFRMKTGSKLVSLWNTNVDEHQTIPGLAVVIKKLGKKSSAACYVKCSLSVKELTANYYGASFSPKLYPGQRVEATLLLAEAEKFSLLASIYVLDKNHEKTYQSTGVPLQGKTHLSYQIPPIHNAHLSEVGIIIHNTADGLVNAKVVLQALDWSGEPTYTSDFTKERAEADAITQWTFYRGYWRLEQQGYVGSGPQGGESYTGSIDWKDYTFAATLERGIGKGHGIMARVQGARRGYAFVIKDETTVLLLKKVRGEFVELGRSNTTTDQQCSLQLRVQGNHIQGFVDGDMVINLSDEDNPYLFGQVGLISGAGGRLNCKQIALSSV